MTSENMAKRNYREALLILKKATDEFLCHVHTPDDLPSREPYQIAKANLLKVLALAGEVLPSKPRRGLGGKNET